MGAYNYIPYRQRKRKDYELSEIEKKYTEEDLSKLIILNYIQNYPKLRVVPGRICNICRKNLVEEQLQLSGFILCNECYQKEKDENFKEMIKILSERNITYEGSTILDSKLILGSIETSFLKDKLKSLGVTHVLMIGYFMTPIYPEDFIYGNFEINDDSHENILQYLIEGIKFIDNSSICYCHCQLGKSRSASFVIAYIMYKNKIHFSEAFNLVRKKRKMIFPNEGFQCQLEDFDIILSNYDYDLNKCDEFIKKYLKERDELRIKEKDYIIKTLQEHAEKGKRKYSDHDLDSDDDNDSGKIEVKMGNDDDDEKENNNYRNKNDDNQDKNNDTNDDTNNNVINNIDTNTNDIKVNNNDNNITTSSNTNDNNYESNNNNGNNNEINNNIRENSDTDNKKEELIEEKDEEMK